VADLNPYQQKIVKRYYENLDALAVQKLAELTSDLYLASAKKRQGLWTRIEAALRNLKIPQERIDHLRKQDDPALLAGLVKELQG
jgi:hypothetical protein